MTVNRRTFALAPLVAISLAGCGLNSVPTAEEVVNAPSPRPVSRYQRRQRSDRQSGRNGEGRRRPRKAQSYRKSARPPRPLQRHPDHASAPPICPIPPRSRRSQRTGQVEVAVRPLMGDDSGALSRTTEVAAEFLVAAGSLEGTENRINASRRDYRPAVKPIIRGSARSPTRSAPGFSRRQAKVPSPPRSPRRKPQVEFASELCAGGETIALALALACARAGTGARRCQAHGQRSEAFPAGPVIDRAQLLAPRANCAGIPSGTT